TQARICRPGSSAGDGRAARAGEPAAPKGFFQWSETTDRRCSMRVESFRLACVALVSASLVSLGLQTPAVAGVVGTSEAMVAGQPGDALARVQGVLARDDVRARMIEMGVSPTEVQGRIAALTPSEVADLANRLDQAPAGGDAVWIIGAV